MPNCKESGTDFVYQKSMWCRKSSSFFCNWQKSIFPVLLNLVSVFGMGPENVYAEYLTNVLNCFWHQACTSGITSVLETRAWETSYWQMEIASVDFHSLFTKWAHNCAKTFLCASELCFWIRSLSDLGGCSKHFWSALQLPKVLHRSPLYTIWCTVPYWNGSDLNQKMRGDHI